MVRDKKISKRKMRIYKVMRILFNNPETFDELINETDFYKRELKGVLSYLFDDYLLEKRESNGKVKYFITERGKNRLAYWEFYNRFFSYWQPYWAKGRFQREYEEEIADIIKNSTFY